MRKNNWVRTFALVILGIGSIVAIVTGYEFQKPQRYYDDYNWALFFTMEGGIVLLSAFFLALASILDQVSNAAKYIKITLTKEQIFTLAKEEKEEAERRVKL